MVTPQELKPNKQQSEHNEKQSHHEIGISSKKKSKQEQSEKN